MVEAPLVLPLLTSGLLWWLFAALAAGALPRVLESVRPLVPHQRSLCLLAIALYPPFVALGLSLVLYTPALTGFAIDAHCHAGVCSLHVPMLRASSGLVLLATVILMLALFAALSFVIVALWRNVRMTRLVAQLARGAEGRDFSLLDSERLIACCLGILRPTIVVSSGLKMRADAREMEIVLMHEHAHRYRLDNLRNLMAGLSTLVWPAARRAQLLVELRLAAEQSCDQAVAAAVGDRLVVAGTIDRLRGIQHESGLGSAKDDLFVAARLAALEHSDWVSWRRGRAWFVFALVTATPLLALAHPLHRAFEFLVATL
jgi:Zn-dependent protease with chaperone function